MTAMKKNTRAPSMTCLCSSSDSRIVNPVGQTLFGSSLIAVSVRLHVRFRHSLWFRRRVASACLLPPGRPHPAASVGPARSADVFFVCARPRHAQSRSNGIQGSIIDVRFHRHSTMSTKCDTTSLPFALIALVRSDSIWIGSGGSLTSPYGRSIFDECGGPNGGFLAAMRWPHRTPRKTHCTASLACITQALLFFRRQKF